MPRLTGNKITIGSGGNAQTDNYFYIDYNTYDDAANNRTWVTWSVGWHFTWSDARLVWGYANFQGSRYFTGASTAHAFSSNFTTRDVSLAASSGTNSGGFYVYHNSTGNATLSIAGDCNTEWANSSVSASIPLTNYDVSPTTPTISTIARSSDGSQISTFSYSGGVNNSGQTPTYTIEYSTSSNFATIAGTASSAPFSLPSATTQYYFRVKASNDDGTKYSTVSSVYYGAPSAPTFTSGQGAATSTTIANSVSLTWTAPSNTQTSNGTAGLTYDVYRGGTKITSSPISATSYSDTGLDRGVSYSYYVVAINNVGSNNSTSYSRSATVLATASGVPAAPAGSVSINKVGRNVTVSCQESPNGYNNIIAGYKVQYSTDNGDTWSAPESMTSRSYQYILLPPALTYIFRCYAINIIGNGDTLSSVPVFVSAGGRRKLSGGDFEPTQTAKRYDSTRPEGQRWVDLNTAKRYSSAANNGAGGWIDLS